MTNPTLLNMLIKNECIDIMAYRCYKDTLIEYANDIDKFNLLIADIKLLSDIQYDFQTLSIESKKLNITRRDYRELCDMICIIIGDVINEMNKYNQLIVTRPSQFEDYCPFPHEDLVAYGKVNDTTFNYDGNTY